MDFKALVDFKDGPVFIPRGEILKVIKIEPGVIGLICWCRCLVINGDELFPVSSEFIINFCDKMRSVTVIK